MEALVFRKNDWKNLCHSTIAKAQTDDNALPSIPFFQADFGRFPRTESACTCCGKQLHYTKFNSYIFWSVFDQSHELDLQK